MLWKLCDWEQNMYHDSYFYDGYFNDETNEFQSHETGATAYASGSGSLTDQTINNAPSEVIERCHNAMVKRVFDKFKRSDELRQEPNNVDKGVRLKLRRNVRHKGVTYPKDAVGEVFWSGAYGTFYKKGYNKPNRGNVRVGIKLESGESIFVALSACVLACGLKSDDQLMATAISCVQTDSTAVNMCVGVHAWTTHNWWAKQVPQKV